ncbi:MAG: MBL fold metallo-hydrolase [Bacteroidetes bacterium]|nr:MBL fold metallo-hydrolase [Bacteroidota bacterium]
MKLFSINTGYFKLDGGAMHGVVPKSLWQRYNPADGNNLCNWAMRCLLIDTGSRRVLIDNGMGDKQDAKFLSHYYLNGNDSLLASLAKVGYGPGDITDNWLTHLHFDHCGGGIAWNRDHTGYEPLFPNATYHVHAKQWDWAMHPNAREKASFLKDNLLPMQTSGHMAFMEDPKTLDMGFDMELVFGHTEAMMLPKITYGGKTMLYMADLCPSVAHLRIAWVMGYDIRPLETMKERARILEMAADLGYILFFEHDEKVECCSVQRTDSGVAIDQVFALAEAGF